MRSSVVLPEPDGPSSASNSPERTSRLTPSSAAKSPKRLVTLTTEIFMSLLHQTVLENDFDDESHQRKQRQERRYGERGGELVAVVKRLDVQRHGIGLAA